MPRTSRTASGSTTDDARPDAHAAGRVAGGARRRLGRDDARRRRAARRRCGSTPSGGAPVDLRAAPASLLGFAAWLAGEGALAWCAVGLRPEAEPDYWLAALLAQALAGAVPPVGVAADPAGGAHAVRRLTTPVPRRPRASRLPTWVKTSTQQEFTREDRTRYREKVRRCLDVFARMLRESRFDADYPMTGLEIELNLVDEVGDPALKSAEALEAIADPDFQTELGAVQPRDQRAAASGSGSAASPSSRTTCARASTTPRSKAAEVGAHMVMIGILPTLSAGHLSPATLSPNPRYQLLSDQILAARGEDIVIDIDGPERLRTTSDIDRARGRLHEHPAAHPGQPRAASRPTGTPPRRSPASSSRSARTRRSCSASELWRETRIPLFEQATDTRSEELKAQGVRPRVWFGERWINSIFDLFEENVRYFPALLPMHRGRGPARGARVRRDARRWPSSGCTTAPSTAGTDRSTTSSTARPHLRVENRVLPAGPTVVDTMANAAFYFGLVRTLAEQRAAAVVADVLQRRRGELPRRRPARDRGQRLLARPGRGARHRAGAAPAAADGARRAWTRGA